MFQFDEKMRDLKTEALNLFQIFGSIKSKRPIRTSAVTTDQVACVLLPVWW